MTGVELWGSVVPAWLGGVGGLAAAVVGTIALIQSLRASGGVRTLRRAANSAQQSISSPDGTSNATSEQEPPAVGAPVVSPVSWTAWNEGRNHYRLRNDSTRNGAVATLTGFSDVTPDGDGAATYAGPLPVTLQANESVPFSIEKTLVSPSVTAVELTWDDADGTSRKRTLYI